MFVTEETGEHLRVLGSAVTVKATSNDTGGAIEWVVVESGPRADVALHRHPWGEAYFILDGTLEVQVGARKHQATVGAFVMIPPRALHGFHVVSDLARFLHVSIGAGAVAAFRDYSQVSPEPPDPNDPETLSTLAEVNARHAIDFLTPEPA
jgi:quercetin dioxygenase-like cupin family protein